MGERPPDPQPPKLADRPMPIPAPPLPPTEFPSLATPRAVRYSNRALGFYWVRLADRDGGGPWTVAEWADRTATGCEWWLIAMIDNPVTDSSFAEIGPRVESPEEIADERAVLLAFLDEMRVKYEAAEMDSPSDKHLQYAQRARRQ